MALIKIGNVLNLLTTVKTSIVAAINENVTKVGDLTSLTTNDKTSVVNAITSVKTDVDGVAQDTITLKIYKASNFR